MIPVQSAPDHATAHGRPAQQLHRVLGWRSGVFLTLTTILGVFTTVGYMIGLVGGWAVIAIWAVSMVVAIGQTVLYAELATMFPGTAGGVAAYTHEALRRYSVFVGPVVTWGYWLGYSLIQAVTALILGNVIQAEWFPRQTWQLPVLSAHVGLGNFIGAAALLATYLLNVFGIKIAARLTGVGVVIFSLLTVLMIVAPFVTGTWSPHLLTWDLHSWRLALVLLYLAGYTTYAVEGASLFTPEYRKPASDTPRALRVSGLVMLAVFVLVPLATTGAIGKNAIAANPSGYAVQVFVKYFHGGASLVVAVLVAGLVATLIGCSAEAGRALLGIAREDLTIRQLDRINRFGMPGRALTMDVAVNLAVLFLVGNTVAIIAASNFGYILCVALSCLAFVLLRRDRPAWPRPHRVRDIWVPAAIGLFIFNLVIAVVGIASPSLTGYGNGTDTVIALVLLFACIPLFLVRKLGQDRQWPFRWREETAATPPATADPAAAVEPAPPAGHGRTDAVLQPEEG